MGNAQTSAPHELARLRAAVLADAALQEQLRAFDNVDDFIPPALALAAARGIHLEDGDLRRALRDDPIGALRWSDAPPGDAVPPLGWLPVNVLPASGQLCIDWAYFGEASLAEPFFEDSVRVALRRPLNRLARYRTRLIDLPGTVARHASVQPSGLIFHMSRCGSTLVSQMLAADPGNIVISEASPLDTAVRVNTGSDPGAGERHAALLRAMIGALGQRRAAAQERYFLKLDCWHTLAMPLFRAAFADVPWVFMYREPSEVLASQMSERGIQTIPEYLPPALFGLSDDDARDSESYCARVLARTCEAVLQPYAQGGGLLVNYRELPQAFLTRILPHFGVAPADADEARVAAVAARDAKTPGLTYAGSNAVKRNLMTDALRATADRHIGAVYRQLESLRAGR